MDDDFVGNDFLAKRQWNHLAQILKGSSPGLDPSLFKRTFRYGDWAGFNVDVPAISYRDSEYYFSIAEYVEKRRGIVPGSSPSPEDR